MRTALAPHVINWWSKKIPMTPGCQQSILWHQYKSILDKSKHKIFYCSLVVGWDCWVTCRLCRGGDPWSSKAWCVKSVVISSLVIRTTTQFKWSRDRSEIGLVTSDSCFDDGHSLVNNITSYTRTAFYTKVEVMEQPDEYFSVQAIRVVGECYSVSSIYQYAYMINFRIHRTSRW